mgnify:CR=1 FL=1
METELLQGMIEIIFRGNLLYLSPILFILMIIIFADHFIELIGKALNTGNSSGRRGHY